jgi:hypothetical protein
MKRTQQSTSGLLSDMNALRRATEQLQIPAGAVPFHAQGSAPMPAYGLANQIVIGTVQPNLCQYQVQAGWQGLLTGIMLIVTGDGGSWVVGSGDVVFTVDVDIPLADPLATGRFLPQYSQVIRPIGSFEEPWPIPGWSIINRGWTMQPLETYRAKVYSLANVSQGSPCFVHASLCGIVWPQC